MVLRILFRPVLVAAAATTLSACGVVEADPARFENLARMVSACRWSGRAARPHGPPPTSDFAAPGP
jgi:hypothetical protein